ncbi:hypothetical protein WR25_13355 [Diploscapter pachys]|uniref:Uncharacterized protein n=1 Tax=Diploscapter pachys TaxID=2018661 RepID=A0A2A2KNN5_9BILA|nr:hypothetical protein WR25_13355 [Diploscapter pachys]
MRVAANPELVKRLDEEVPRIPRTLKVVLPKREDVETCVRRVLYMKDYNIPGVTVQAAVPVIKRKTNSYNNKNYKKEEVKTNK